jgi:hypothetical protein
MKALGIVAIFAVILVIILALTGVIGQGAGRAVIIAAIILLAAGSSSTSGACARPRSGIVTVRGHHRLRDRLPLRSRTP